MRHLNRNFVFSTSFQGHSGLGFTIKCVDGSNQFMRIHLNIDIIFSTPLQGHAGLGFAIGEGRRAQDGENGIFIRNVTEGGTAYKVTFCQIV